MSVTIMNIITKTMNTAIAATMVIAMMIVNVTAVNMVVAAIIATFTMLALRKKSKKPSAMDWSIWWVM